MKTCATILLLSAVFFVKSTSSVVIDGTVLYLSFLAYRRTNILAFAFLIWASLLGIILEMGLHTRTPTSAEDALSFHEWYRVGYFACTVLSGIGVTLLIQHVRRDFAQKSPPNPQRMELTGSSNPSGVESAVEVAEVEKENGATPNDV
jgi:hypothetical protein